MDYNPVKSTTVTAAKCVSDEGAYLSHSTEQINNMLTGCFI